MQKNNHLLVLKPLILLIFLLTFNTTHAQESSGLTKTMSDFWENVQFGGGIGLNFFSGYTDVFLAPSAIYNLNSKVSLGAGLNLNYVASSNNYTSILYGISTLVLVNPIPEIQFSVGLNQSRVNYEEKNLENYSENYWDTSLILGAGYRTGNVVIGIGYNVLQNGRYNTDPLVPFVRAYF